MVSLILLRRHQIIGLEGLITVRKMEVKNEEVKSSKSKVIKALCGLGVVALIAYNGWVVYNNHFGSGSVKGTVKELLVENIPQCLDEDVIGFVELEDVKLDKLSDNKWDGEATARLKARGTGKTGSGRFTFEVEKKGSMVYVNNLKIDEASAENLLADENPEAPNEGVSEGGSKSKVTDWASYVKDLNTKAEQMTDVQKQELCQSEVGRPVEIVVTVDDVSELSEDGGSCYVIQSRTLPANQNTYVYVSDVENSREAYKQAKLLRKNSKIKVIGVIFFIESPFFLNIDPRIACLQLSDLVEDCSSLDQQYDELMVKMVKLMGEKDVDSVPDKDALEKDKKRFRALPKEEKEKLLGEASAVLKKLETK